MTPTTRLISVSLAVSRVTLSQLIRDPAILISVVICLILVCSAPAYAVFHFGEVRRVMIDTGLSTALLAGLMVALLGSVRALAFEVEDRTALTLLSKPVSRLALVVGRFGGVASTSAAVSAGLCLMVPYVARVAEAGEESGAPPLTVPVGLVGVAAVLLALVAALAFRRARAAAAWIGLAAPAAVGLLLGNFDLAGLGPAEAWRWEVLWAGALIVLEVTVVVAAATAAATRLGAVGAAATVLAFVVAGHARPLAAGGFGCLGGIVPGLEALNGLEAAAAGLSVGMGYVCWASVYAALYSAAAVLIGAAALQRREMT